MFITLEGPDGSGKTSQIAPLAEAIRAQGYDLVVTREPGGTGIGDEIRQVLFNLKNKEMHPRSEILLFQASRAQLVEEIIQPALAAGKIVLCDRYADSTMAYQGYGHGIDLNRLQQIVEFATGGLRPDLTLFLKVGVEEGLKRRGKDGDWNRLDDYDLEFHKRVNQGYKTLIAAEPQRWVIVDATRPAKEVAAELRQIVLNRLKQTT